MIKLPIFILTWLLFFIFNTITIILGWILIPPMALLNKYTTEYITSIINGRTILVWKHKFMYPWSNNEDGLNGGEEYPDKPLWFRIIYWSALRNPSNNLRFFKTLTCQLDPNKIKYIVSNIKLLVDTPSFIISASNLTDYDQDYYRFTSLTWQGYYSNFRIQFKMFGKIWRFWIGWKIYPHDSNGIASTDYRRFGAGFATQFKRIYPRK